MRVALIDRIPLLRILIRLVISCFVAAGLVLLPGQLPCPAIGMIFAGIVTFFMGFSTAFGARSYTTRNFNAVTRLRDPSYFESSVDRAAQGLVGHLVGSENASGPENRFSAQNPVSDW